MLLARQLQDRLPAARHRTVTGAVSAVALILALAPTGPAQERSADQSGAAALALLERHCTRCHNAEKQKGGLVLGGRQHLLEGGDSGPAIVPGAAGISLLAETLFPGADPHMPPKSQLDPAEIQTIEEWISAGAPWDPATWDRVRNARHHEPVQLGQLPAGTGTALAVALSPDGRWLAAGRGSTVDLFDLADLADPPSEGAPPTHPSPAHQLHGHRDVVQSLTWSPDGTRLASGGFRRVIVWDAPSFGHATELDSGLAGRITALEFSRDGDTLVVADSVPSARSPVHWWHLESGEVSTAGSAHQDSVLDLETSPDGGWLASAGADRVVHLWRASDRQLAATLEGHTGFVLAIAFSPASDRLATGGDDGAIKVWDVATRKQVSGFGSGRGAGSAVAGLAWMTDAGAEERRSSESDPDKAAAINTDRIVAVFESGQPAVFTNLVEHAGGERSKGADRKSLPAAGAGGSTALLTGIAIDRTTGGFYSTSTAGGVHAWSGDGETQMLRPPAASPLTTAAR